MFTSPFGNIMQGITVVEREQRLNLRAKIHLFCSLHRLKICESYASTLLLSFVSLPPHKPHPTSFRILMATRTQL